MKVLALLTHWGGVLNRLTGWRLSRLNRWVYRVTGGVLGDATPGAHLILLTTTGRKTGQPRTVPVASWSIGSDLVVGAHAGGSRIDPQWLRNLRANPRARVQLKREVFAVEATEVPDDQRDALLCEIAKTHPFIEFYERRAPRRAPFVRLVRM